MKIFSNISCPPKFRWTLALPYAFVGACGDAFHFYGPLLSIALSSTLCIIFIYNKMLLSLSFSILALSFYLFTQDLDFYYSFVFLIISALIFAFVIFMPENQSTE